MKIAIIGAGYVGFSLAVLLSQNNEVAIYDIIPEKIEKINNRISPIHDDYIEKYLTEKKLNMKASSSFNDVCNNAYYIIIALPTNYDNESLSLNTSLIESAIKTIQIYNKEATIVIKSTVPIGYTEMIRKQYGNNIIYSPEFLRESKALYDNLYPSRIVIGTDKSDTTLTKKAEQFAKLLKDNSLKENTEILITGTTEAESIKLFANTYLALRISYFNELDTYAELKGLNAKDIIKGVCLDPRIGDFYNNPSFGYGGYCLPKDSKQLLTDYNDIPQNMVTAIIESNETRKNFISDRIIEKVNTFSSSANYNYDTTNTIGIYRLLMKSDSDNFRHSSILDIIDIIKTKKVKILIYEPLLENNSTFQGCLVVNNLQDFINQSKIIIANRYDSCLDNVKEKVYTRDLFKRD